MQKPLWEAGQSRQEFHQELAKWKQAQYLASFPVEPVVEVQEHSGLYKAIEAEAMRIGLEDSGWQRS